jgi:alginate O-acetyltransferase complex protein AlgI
MLVYHLTANRAKLIVGILGSMLFYAWGNLIYLPIMIGILVASYLLAIGIDRWRDRRISRILLWAGVAINVLLLIQFKLWTEFKFPLGLSYVTFQAIAYLVEVYRKLYKSERDILKFSFYLLMFPKILVGPITRYSQIKDQIEDIRVDAATVAGGLRRFIVGFTKKALIADTLARVVTPVFALSSPSISPALAWLVILSYSLQIFFDFSGYTDMAIGLGRMMGVRFIENFDRPYLSKSISEFWRRWHISLSSWFRDMVFYPLERRRFRWFGQQINILIVFTLTGLWHGLTINFLIWGLIHGFAIVFEYSIWGRKLRTFWAPLQHIYAMMVVVIAWVFFRSPNLDFAITYLYRLVGNTSGVGPLSFQLTSPLPFIEPSFILAFILGIILLFPIPAFFKARFPKLSQEGTPLGFTARLFGDLALIGLLFLSVAANAGTAYLPGIYGNF